MIDPDATAEIVRDAERLVETIQPLLAGRPPELIGIVLAELVAMLIAGHAPPLRDVLVERHAELVRDLMPSVLEDMIAAGRAPEEWRA